MTGKPPQSSPLGLTTRYLDRVANTLQSIGWTEEARRVHHEAESLTRLWEWDIIDAQLRRGKEAKNRENLII